MISLFSVLPTVEFKEFFAVYFLEKELMMLVMTPSSGLSDSFFYVVPILLVLFTRTVSKCARALLEPALVLGLNTFESCYE